ncbi:MULTISPECIES: PRC-barrel domain-containing protein [Microvirga]|uniref:PRC-barrel domain-containing protein n=1 Tax=Microvirga TaxID=186650 RepID=UPI00191DDA67|nr:MULTISPECIES: PRC-barrel domain-containing protein [Microvirga]MBM6581681.1 PRC-barrel domain-containing protein [Microvirga arvi]
MGKRILVGSLAITALAGSFMSLGHAQGDQGRRECDRLISALEGMAPAEAYEALQKMRVYRQGSRYKACVDTGVTLQTRSPRHASLRAEQFVGMDVFNEKSEQVGNVNRLALGGDQRIYVLMTYRGPRWPGNKQVAIPLERITLDGGRLLLPGIGEQDLLAMPAVPANGGVYRSLRSTELVAVLRYVASATDAGDIRRRP